MSDLKFLLILILFVLAMESAFSQDKGLSRSNEEEFLSSLPEKPRISDTEWQEIAGDTTEQLYIVQHGDTLWDICQQFFDSPFYWPKLWQVNESKITNPHAIEVGTELRFLTGSGTQLPGIEVSEQKPDFLDQSVDLLPDTSQKESQYDDLGFKKGLVVQKKIVSKQHPVGFIARDSIPNYGEIVGSFQTRTYFTASDIVYVEISDKDKVRIGNQYSIFKYEGSVSDPDSMLGFSLGRWVRLLGDLRVLDINEGRARCQVLHAGGEIARGSFITNYYPPHDNIQKNFLSQQLKADVVLLSHGDQTFEEAGGIVHLNRGTNDGIKVGTVFNIIATKDGVTESDEYVEPEIKGQVMVIHTEAYSSTATILTTAQEVYIGDLAISATK